MTNFQSLCNLSHQLLSTIRSHDLVATDTNTALSHIALYGSSISTQASDLAGDEINLSLS
jgi:hypothetical protein